MYYPTTVRWSKEGGILPPARSIDDGNGNLVVINANPADSGTYVCTAYDTRTYVTQRVYITVGGEFVSAQSTRMPMCVALAWSKDYM
ncbi:Basement membrane-specific heparan sulfate proteoglycan core protein [Sarracenia purpurea var. burkii]